MPETIEAEVLEIDGSPPPPPSQPREAAPKFGSDTWKTLQGRVLQLDRRWWPLWVLFGIIAFVVIMFVGSLVALAFVVAKVLGGILRFLAGGGSPRGGTGLSRQTP